MRPITPGWWWLGPLGRPGRSILLPSQGHDREQAICWGCRGIVMYLYHVFLYGDGSVFVGSYEEADSSRPGYYASPMWIHVDSADEEACFVAGRIAKGPRF